MLTFANDQLVSWRERGCAQNFIVLYSVGNQAFPAVLGG
jgi:hypothetical protein